MLGRRGLKPGPAGVSPHRKKEGDGCAPIGVFALRQAFGSVPRPAGVTLPWLRTTDRHLGVDDPRSYYYNQIIDGNIKLEMGHSFESMTPASGAYEMGLVIEYNPSCIRGAGSCIFMHISAPAGRPTAGCTTMSRDHLLTVLRWLRPEKVPVLIQQVMPARP